MQYSRWWKSRATQCGIPRHRTEGPCQTALFNSRPPHRSARRALGDCRRCLAGYQAMDNRRSAEVLTRRATDPDGAYTSLGLLRRDGGEPGENTKDLPEGKQIYRPRRWTPACTPTMDSCDSSSSQASVAWAAGRLRLISPEVGAGRSRDAMRVRPGDPTRAAAADRSPSSPRHSTRNTAAPGAAGPTP